MACKFDIGFEGTAEHMYAKMNRQLGSAGGSLNGDANQGDFAISVMGMEIAGTYAISGQVLQITVNKKPMLIGCGQLETYLKNNL